MKTARTYIFMFVPIPPGSANYEPMIPCLRAGSNGISPPEQKMMTQPDGECEIPTGGETQALPDHLFWTWFIDNPRPQSSK